MVPLPPLGPPPLPPIPPDLEGMQPHERARAKKAFDERWASYQARLGKYKEMAEDRDNHMEWMLAVMVVIAGVSVAVFTGVIFWGTFTEFGIKGPLTVVVGCLAFAWAVCEVKKRL